MQYYTMLCYAIAYYTVLHPEKEVIVKGGCPTSIPESTEYNKNWDNWKRGHCAGGSGLRRFQ